MTSLGRGTWAQRRSHWLIYLALALIGGIWAAVVVHRHSGRISDWLEFEIAARTFIHFQHNVVYAGNPLGLYARDPSLQFGPPSWLPVAGFQWLSPKTVNYGFVAVMVCLGLAAVRAVDVVSLGARVDVSPRRRTLMLMAVGAAVMADWGYNSGRWHHLDDAMALSFTALACVVIQRRRPWWLAGLLLGTAVAAKPWAIILVPVVWGLPRETRSKAALATIVVAGAWWAPFVIGGSGTVHALGTFPVTVGQGSVLWLLGAHGSAQHWLRPAQFIGGVLIGLAVARRGENAWLAAPLAALAFRVLTDPYVWSYYGLGPVLFAMMWDLTRTGRWSRLPLYSASALAVEGLLPWLVTVLPDSSSNVWALPTELAKLAWGVAVLAGIAWETRRTPSAPSRLLVST